MQLPCVIILGLLSTKDRTPLLRFVAPTYGVVPSDKEDTLAHLHFSSSKILSTRKVLHSLSVSFNLLFIVSFIFEEVSPSVGNHIELKSEVICHRFSEVFLARDFVIEIVERM